MWTFTQRSIAVVLVTHAGLAAAMLHSGEKVSPELEPRSDKKFFGKDYPGDKRPIADKHYVFDHPYPAVQDTSDFDRDFVKDENSDGGRWKAQMDYDILRQKITEAEKKLKDLAKQLEGKSEDWQKAKTEYGESSVAAEAAEDARKKAEKAAGNAAARVNELEGSSSKEGTKSGGAVGDAVHKVDGEMSDLEDCKKRLAEAKEQLRELMKKKEEQEKANEKAEQAAKDAEKAAKDAETAAKDKAAKVKKEEENKEAAKKDKKKKAQDEAKERIKQNEDQGKIRKGEKELAEDEVEERTKAEASWKGKMNQEKEQHAKAEKSYEEADAEVKKTEAELEEAAKNLRVYRRPPHVDNNGGVYNVPDEKSAAVQSPIAVAVGLLVALVAIVQM